MSRKDAIGTVIGTALLGLLALVFAGAGLWADALVMRAAYEDLRMTAWNEIPCDILTAQLVATGAKNVSYHVEAKYRYKVDGVEHVGRRVTTFEGSDNVSSFHQRAFNELEQCRLSGKPFRCYVNPTHPDEAILYRDARWDTSLFVTLFGLMFSTVGFGLMGILIYSVREKPSSARKLPIDEAQPWLARVDWAAGEIRHSDRFAGRVLSWLGWPILVISAPSLLASLSEIVLRFNPWAAFGLIPTGIAVLLLRGSRRFMSRWRRYGDSTFQMAAVPGVVGGQLAGVIRTEGPVDSPAGFSLKLACKQSQKNNSNPNSGHTSRGLWENEHAMQVSDMDGTAIPVLFHLPFDAPQTCSDSGPVTRTWHLSVQALNPAADYRAKFEVPVFRISTSDSHDKPDDRELSSRQIEDGLDAPSDASLDAEPTNG